MTKQTPAAPRTSARIWLLSLAYSAAAGAIAAVTFVLMKTLQGWLWHFSDARWYIFLVVLSGGAVLAWLRSETEDVDLDGQIAAAADPRTLRWKKTGFLALSAIVAVAFGGAIGPEAGLLAVVAELSVIVSRLIAKSRAEEQVIGRTGNAAALSGLYGSPPAGAVYGEEDSPFSRSLGLAAGLCGFFAFLTVVRLAGIHPHGLHLPPVAAWELGSLLLAVVPAFLAAGAALCYGYLRDFLSACHRKLGPAWMQSLIGSVALAALLAAWPVLRFSGHDELSHVADWAAVSAWGTLLAVAAAKALATALSLAAGWRGGEFFPLAFIGGALGAVCLAFVPGLDPGTAVLVGMAAAATVALGKPLAVLLIVLLMAPGLAVAPVMLAVLIGMVLIRLTGRQPAAHH